MKKIRILLVEDSPGDAELIRDVLEETKRMHVEMTTVVDGEDAVDYLLQRGIYHGVDRPDLVVLDLNIPKMNGRDVLAIVKQHDHLGAIPIVVLTTSDTERDVDQSYALGVNCYVTKPIEVKAFQSQVHSIENFWLNVAKLP